MRAPSTTRLVLSLLILAVLGLWLVWLGSSNPLAPAAGSPNAPTTSSVRSARPTSGERDELAAEPQRVQAPTSESDANASQANQHNDWCIHLAGVRGRTPWTAPLVIVFEGRYRVEAVATAAVGGGAAEPQAARFVPPPGARLPGIQHLVLIGRDPNYRLIQAHHRTDSLQTTGHLTVRVEPVARLQGRILGPDGRGIAARVRAFGWSKQTPQPHLLGRADAHPDGTYELKLPPKTPALLVADVVGPPLRDVLVVQAEPGLATGWPGDMEQPTRADNLYMDDDRVIQRELLPASLISEGTFLQLQRVPNLQIQRAAMLTGRATTTEGKPVPFHPVTAQPRASQEPAWTTSPWETGLHYLPAYGVVRAVVTHAAADGTFALYAPAGVPLTIAAPPTKTRSYATAPGYTELIFPKNTHAPR